MNEVRTRKRSSTGRIVLVSLDTAATTPLYLQVYAGIRARILDGSLRRNAPLPSSRALARDLSVSRSTVIQAYAQLRAEGYLRCRMGAATRVCAELPDLSMRVASAPPPASARPAAAGLSARGRSLLSVKRPMQVLGNSPRAFRTSVPAVDIFPVDAWGRILVRRWRQTPARAMAYGQPFGYLPLREAIVEYLAAARGLRCAAEQVMIVNGSQQALNLAASVLLDPGDGVWVEDPGYQGAWGAFTAAAARVMPVAVDGDGLVVAEGLKAAPDARLAFVTPSRQQPLGVTLSLPRRLALIEWARTSAAWIIEDDYDSEFRYSGRPLGSLYGLDPDGCVIYAGTFSKVTLPSLRLGYVVVPTRLIEAFTAARYFSDYATSYLQQAVMADFITEGHFERHIRRTRAVYQERQELLVELAQRDLGDLLRVNRSEAGMNLIGWMPEGTSDEAFARTALRHGVDVLPISLFTTRPYAPGLLLGYSGVRDVEIREGIERLIRARAEFRRAGGLGGRRLPKLAAAVHARQHQ